MLRFGAIAQIREPIVNIPIKIFKNLFLPSRFSNQPDIKINTIKVYLASSADEINRNKYENLTVLKNIPLEYSTEIIENRPDYIQEEANIRRIGFDVSVAKREFLPKFIIFGQIGLNAYQLSTLFNSASQMFSAGILPFLDLFAGGRKIALLKFKKFEYEEALNSYQKTILEGIKEINTGLTEYKEASENYNKSLKCLKLQKQIYALVKDKEKIGSASNLEVLYAKETYLSAKKKK